MAENSQNLTKLPPEDFATIENAVMETERGRWFLKEYAARNRHAETENIIESLGRIEAAMTEKAEEISADIDKETISAQGDKIKFDLLDMMTAIANTKREIAAIGSEDENNSHINSATLELDAIVEATESATSKILETAEKIQEEAWTLREEGGSDEHCDKLDELSTEIYMACSFQDITGQRTQKVVQVLRYLENRLESMANIWADENVSTPEPESDIDFKSEVEARPDAHLLNGPQQQGSGIEQDDVDLMFVDAEDVRAADEMEAMLKDMDEPIENIAESSDIELDRPEPSDPGSLLEDNTQEVICEEDDLFIVKEESPDKPSTADCQAFQIDKIDESVTQKHSERADAMNCLSASDKEALFSTHEV